MAITKYSMVLIWLVAGFLPLTKPLTIDDFTLMGGKNNIGCRRKVTGKVEKISGKFSLRHRGLITELLTSKSKYIDITGKAVRLTYSSTTRSPLTLSVVEHIGKRKKRKRTETRNHSVRLVSELGNRNYVIVPLTKFQFANLSKIKAILIAGQMMVHELELIDDIKFVLSNPVVTPPEQKCLGSPVLLIDDFIQELDPRTNILNHERQFSKTAVKTPGSISLVKEHDYIEEFFSSQASPFKLRYTALRIVYSSEHTGIVSIGLLHTIRNDIEYVSALNVEISSGSMLHKVVPISLFTQNNPLFDGRSGYGAVIRGSVTLHRLELIMNEDEKQAITHSLVETGAIHETYKFIEKYTYLRNALQLLRIPQTRSFVFREPDILTEALSVMDINSFRMDMDVHFPYIPLTANVSGKQMFFDLIYKAISMHGNGLFEKIGNKKKSLNVLNEQMGNKKKLLRIIPMLNMDPDKSKYYRLIGRIIGMAIMNQTMQMINFVPSFYKILLDLELDVSDLDIIDSTIYDQLQVQFTNENLDNEKITMSVKYQDNTEEKIADLVPNGRDILVGRHNQLEYEAAYCKWHADRLIGSQAHALREGLYDVIPKSLLDWFNPEELRHIMNGGRF